MAGKKFKQRKTDVIQDGIVYRLDNSSYTDYKGTYYVYTYTDDLPESVVVADKIGDVPVTFLDTKCFYHSEFREVFLPDTIEVIKNDAFRHCENLEEISIPNSIQEVQSGAFKRCDKLKQTLYSHGLYIGNPENPYLILRTNKNTGCGNLTVEVHPKTKFILDTAFSVCRENGSVGFGHFDNIKQLILHDNLFFIDDNAFYGSWCPLYIQTICIDSIEWLCKYGIKLPGRLREKLIVGGKDIDGTVVIPASVTNIPQLCFRKCNFIKRVSFEGNISSIGKAAFSCCQNLAEVSINNGMRTIGTAAFEQCAITNLIIPDSVTTIGYMAFSECHNLKSIFITDSVTSIESDAFFGCESLECVYYKGTKKGFKKLLVYDNENNLFDNGKKNIKIYFYSEEKPAEDEMWDYFWHYVDGVPTAW